MADYSLHFSILIAFVLALAMALFQYFPYRKKGSSYLFMALCRFLAIFCAIILLFNPKLKDRSYYTKKTELNILVDNSESIRTLGFDSISKRITEQLKLDAGLQEHFKVHVFAFDENLNSNDSLTYSGKQTNISKAVQLNTGSGTNDPTAIVLISDGNQTIGKDYQYAINDSTTTVFPVVMGDSTIYNDLRIVQLNTNKYAYYKNKFPVEIFVGYEGNKTVNTSISLYDGKKLLHTEKLTLSPENKSQILNFEVLANKIGIQTLRAVVKSVEDEKNTKNNSKLFAIEVIDQKTNIAIIADVLHPDLGALKKSIESNEFRKASILKPSHKNIKYTDFKLFILYQPNYSFKNVIQKLEKLKRNYWLISGLDTDWNFINTTALGPNKKTEYGAEDVFPQINEGFNVFQVGKLEVDDFPPLKKQMGPIDFIASSQPLLYQKIETVGTEEPLLAVIEENGLKKAVLTGEGIWKWRSTSFLKTGNYEEFDTYFGKLIQYLSSNQQRERLTVDYEPFYYGNSNVLVKASYFDKNYVFDPNAQLSINVKDKNTNSSKEFPMLYKGSVYEANLNNIDPSSYSFSVKVAQENLSKSGNFTIVPYEVEKQFVNPNIDKLNALADRSMGAVFYANEIENLKNQLLNDMRYMPIQKIKENTVPLIDWKWLLAITILALAGEWFLRKYRGLI